MRRNIPAVVLVVIALAIAVWAFTRSGSTSRAVAIARAQLSACMTGEPPNTRGPDPKQLRAIQLAGVADWPKRCALYAKDLEHVLAHDPPLEGASRALEANRLFENYSVQSDVNSLLTAQEDEPVLALADVASDVPPPPAPPPLARDVLSIISRDSPPMALGDQDLLLVANPVACHFAARDGGLEPVGHCSYPADATARQWLPVPSPTTDLQVLSQAGVQSFATGELIGPAFTASASNVAGSTYSWPGDASLTTVLRRAPDGTKTILHLPHRLDTATIVRDQLLWTEKDRVVGVDLSGAKIGAPYEVAKSAGLPRTRTCATDAIAATLVVAGNDYRVAVLVKGTWRLSEPGPEYKLLCAGATVVGLATAERSSILEIKRLDCSATGCTQSSATIDHISGPSAVAALGSDTLVVWVDDLVRGISGPLATLATAKPFPIFDGARYEQLDHKQTSQTELLHAVHAVGRGNSAIVILDTTSTSFLVYVRDHKPQRVSLVYD